MSLSRETMLELMALADGELEGPARERAERVTAESEEARRLVESIRSPDLQIWLDETLERRRPSADGIADAVMARLEATHPARRAGTGPRKGKTTGRFSRVAAVGAIVGAALALAAAVAMYARPGDHEGVARTGAAPPGTSAPVGSPETAGTEGAPTARGVEVEEIDSPSHVSIFEIAAVANASTPSSVVVWIDDDPGSK
jgi:anti-sigma factor RsiW